AVHPAPAPATATPGTRAPAPDRAPILANRPAPPAAPTPADTFTVDMGCNRAIIASFPKTLDVLAQCLGSDSKLDVLVTATTAGNVVGYFAARVPTDDNGVGMLDIPAWNTTFTTIPVTENDLGATIEVDEVADGFPCAPPPAPATTTVANAWTGLVADVAEVRAQVGPATAAQTTTQFTAGLPASIAFTATDFLPAATTTVAVRDRT